MKNPLRRESLESAARWRTSKLRFCRGFLALCLHSLSLGAGHLEGDHASEVAAVAHILITGVDVVEFVCARGEFIELEMAAAVQAEQLGNVQPGVCGAEQ